MKKNETEETELQGIDDNAASKLKIANLPTRPNSTTLTGGKGLTADQLRAKIDEYPDALRKCLNKVIEQVKQNLSDIDKILLDLPKKAGEKIVGGGEIFNDYDNNEAIGPNSSASGEGTIATEAGQCVVGKYNNPNAEYFTDALFVVGAGTSDTQRANAFAVLNDGRIIGGAVDIDPTAGYDVVVKKYLDKRLSAVNKDIADVDEIADAAKEIADTNALNIAALTPLAEKAKELAEQAKQIAEGRSRTEVFENKDEMEAWIASKNEQNSLLPKTPFDRHENDLLVLSYDSTVFDASTSYICTATVSYDGTLENNTKINFPPAVVYSGNCFYFYNAQNRMAVYFEIPSEVKKIISVTVTNAPGVDLTATKENVLIKAVRSAKGITVADVSPYNIEIGTNFFLRDTDVPDYWWDGFKAQYLESQKLDLDPYAKKEDVVLGLNLIVEALENIEGEVTV